MSYTVNKVDGFNPEEHIQIAKDRFGKDIIRQNGEPLKYLPTAVKVLWFRKVCPGGRLETISVDTPEREYGTIVRYKARVSDDKTILAEWEHQETVWDDAEMDNIVSKVQTIALGKALSKAGFGCEIELDFDAFSEGETEITPDDTPKEEPKKKRGRPKKEEAPADEDISSEITDLMMSIEESIKEEAVPEPKEEPVEKSADVDAKISEYLEMKLVTTDKAPINIKKMDGTAIKDILADHKDFGDLVKKRPNIQKALSDECVEAIVYIEDHK